MATLTESAHGKLLSKVRPRVIKTEEENERAIAELEALDIRAAQGHPLTPEEAQLLSKLPLGELLTALILQFEAAHYPLGHAAPIDSLRNLMEVRLLFANGTWIPRLCASRRNGFGRAERQAVHQQDPRP